MGLGAAVAFTPLGGRKVDQWLPVVWRWTARRVRRQHRVRARYGDRAHTILNNHRATMLLPGIKDPATLEHASRLVGEADVARASTTWDAHGRRSTTQGVEQRRLAPDHALRTLPNGQAVVIYGSMAPLRVSLRPWYADPTLADRARRDGDPVAPAGVPSWAARMDESACPRK